MRAVVAEFLGALLLTSAVVGSGIMGEHLAQGNLAIALLANTAATVAMLATLIATFGPISGAHFNPVVTLLALSKGNTRVTTALAYISVQVVGCCAGAVLANAMFDLPVVQFSTHERAGTGQYLSELIATAGLVFIAFSSPPTTAFWRVPAWIGAAYWFTASTSFANPAITVGRSLSDTFSGIRPIDTIGFIAAQIVGGLLGLVLLRLIAEKRAEAST
jgi:glycerol uptake facilitator-like aquaporin